MAVSFTRLPFVYSTLGRIVRTQDEVDGVKVFKPTRSDKRSNKPSALSFSKDMSSILKTHPQLVQSKLNLVKKLEPTIDDASTISFRFVVGDCESGLTIRIFDAQIILSAIKEPPKTTSPPKIRRTRKMLKRKMDATPVKRRRRSRPKHLVRHCFRLRILFVK